MEAVSAPRPLLAPPIVVAGQAALPTLREYQPELDDSSFGVHLSADARVWLEASLFSLLVNMSLVIVAGLIFWNSQQSDQIEVVVAQSEAPTDVELVEAPVLVPDMQQEQNLVLGSVADPVTQIDLQQVTLAGSRAAIDTQSFAIDGLVSGDNRARGTADSGIGNGIGDLLGGSFGSRLSAKNAQTGDIQISLIWENKNDLDLHVIPPSQERISFMHPRSRCQGRLDVDMNAGFELSNEPVENIFWPTKRAPNGKYTVLVRYYARRDGTTDDGTFQVAIKVKQKIQTFQGRVRVGEEIEVATFAKLPTGTPVIRPASQGIKISTDD